MSSRPYSYPAASSYPVYYATQYDPAVIKSLIDLAKAITDLAKAQVPILEAALAAATK